MYGAHSTHERSYIFFLLIIFLVFFVFVFASAAPQRPTCSYHANPAGSPTRNDMSLQVGEMPDSNPGLQVLQSGAQPMSHQSPHTLFSGISSCVTMILWKVLTHALDSLVDPHACP